MLILEEHKLFEVEKAISLSHSFNGGALENHFVFQYIRFTINQVHLRWSNIQMINIESRHTEAS